MEKVNHSFTKLERWRRKDSGAVYVITKATTNEVRLENVQNGRRHWVTLQGLLVKYERTPHEGS